jgi:hypothetical protein
LTQPFRYNNEKRHQLEGYFIVDTFGEFFQEKIRVIRTVPPAHAQRRVDASSKIKRDVFFSARKAT